MSDARGDWEAAVRAADLVLVGPAPPLRGGIAMHTRRLGESARAAGLRVATASWSQLYPPFLFPGRSERSGAAADPWSREVLHALGPRSWLRLSRLLAGSRAIVALQWWHPVHAPALAGATRALDRTRLVGICHNALPHEPVPGAGLAARLVLSRCRRIVCHADSQAALVRRMTGAAVEAAVVPLPCLFDEATLDAGQRTQPAAFAGLPRDARVFVAAGHVRPYKGAATLLAAWQRARRPPEARLVLAGESYLRGEARRAIARAAQSDPSILVIDRYVDDEELVGILARAEVVVAPHLATSQSGIVPVARALGRPVIASDAGALAVQAGPGATIVPAGDEAALAVAIERRLASAPRHDGSAASPAGSAAWRPAADPATSAASRSAQWRRVVEAIVTVVRP